MIPQGRIVRLARSTDAELIAQLRNEPWTKEDDNNIVLTIWEGDRLISTMRGDLVSDWFSSRKAFDDVPPPIDHREWPALILSKAATAASDRKTGCNSLLRYYFLKAAMKAGIPRVYGYIPIGAEQTRLMENLGYQFSFGDSHHASLPDDKKWAIAWLNLKTSGAPALAALEHQLCADLNHCFWVGEDIQLEEGEAGLRANMEESLGKPSNPITALRNSIK